MEIFSNLSDDQIALVGCATALLTTGTLMCLSYFIGRARMQGSAATLRDRSAVISGLEAAGAEPANQRNAA